MRGLIEDKRSDLVSRGKRGQKEKISGKTRYEMRVKSKFSSSTRSYNQINMNELFKDNILTVQIPVKGETDDYLVKLKFGSFLDLLHEQLEHTDGKLDLRCILRALIESFNRDNVYIFCNCADFHYRHGYWCTVTKIGSGPPELRPSNITNPHNDLGPGCKHIMLVLSNTGWLVKVASVVNNYIKYFERNRKQQYADIIYPAIYQKKYEEPIQLSFNDRDELDSDTDVIDTANKQGAVSGRFQAGNSHRFQPRQPQKPINGQVGFDDIDPKTYDA